MLPPTVNANDLGHLLAHETIARKLNGAHYNLKTDFGAVGGGADDTAAIAAWIAAACADSGTAYCPPGTYTTTSPIVPTGPFRLLGAGRNASTLRATSGDLFRWGVRDTAVQHISLVSEVGAGHIFNQTGDVAGDLFFDISVTQKNAGQSIYRHVNDAGNYVFNQWLRVKATHVRTGTVPSFHFKVSSDAGATNANTWEHVDFTNPSGAYGFHFESARSANYIYDAILRDIFWEIPSGGCVKVLGGNNIKLENHPIYDLTFQQATAHLFYFGQGTHPTTPAPTRALNIRGVRHIGALASEIAPGVQHIFFETGKVPNAFVEDIRHNVTDLMRVNYGGNAALEVGCPTMARMNAGAVVRVNSSNGVVLPSPDGTAYQLTVANGGALTTTVAP